MSLSLRNIDNMATKIKVGDRVVLKSGGPVLVVVKITPLDPETNRGEHIECMWFNDEAEIDSCEFPAEALKEVG